MNTKLRIIQNDIAMTVGHLSQDNATQEVIYHIPPMQQFDEKNHVRISGLQYYGFSKFLILLEWTNPEYGASYFLVNSNEYKENETTLKLHPHSGGNLEFNEIAKKHLLNEQMCDMH